MGNDKNVSMYLVMVLPHGKHQSNVMLVVVERLTTKAHFILTAGNLYVYSIDSWVA